MKTRLIAALSAVVLSLAISGAAHARTADVCLKVRCSGSSGICITVAIGHNMEVGFPGRASFTIIPCSGKGTIQPPHGQYSSVFVHDADNPSAGFGFIGADNTVDTAVLNKETGEAELTKYDDSKSFSDFESWHSALP